MSFWDRWLVLVEYPPVVKYLVQMDVKSVLWGWGFGKGIGNVSPQNKEVFTGGYSIEDAELVWSMQLAYVSSRIFTDPDQEGPLHMHHAFLQPSRVFTV